MKVPPPQRFTVYSVPSQFLTEDYIVLVSYLAYACIREITCRKTKRRSVEELCDRTKALGSNVRLQQMLRAFDLGFLWSSQGRRKQNEELNKS